MQNYANVTSFRDDSHVYNAHAYRYVATGGVQTCVMLCSLFPTPVGFYYGPSRCMQMDWYLEVPQGANVLSYRLYQKIMLMYSAYGSSVEDRRSSPFFLKQRTHTKTAQPRFHRRSGDRELAFLG